MSLLLEKIHFSCSCLFPGGHHKGNRVRLGQKSKFLESTCFQGMGGYTVGVLDILVPLYHNFNGVILLVALFF